MDLTIGNYQTVLSRIDNSSSIEEIIRGIKILFSITKQSQNNKQIVADCGGIKVIIKTIENFLYSSRICTEGCMILWSIIRGCRIRKQSAIDIGGIELIAKVMKSYSFLGYVCEYCCGLFSNLINYNCINNETLQREVNYRIIRANIISNILKIIRNNFNDIYVCKECCSAICNILNTSLQEDKDKFRKIISVRKGIELILSVEDKHDKENIKTEIHELLQLFTDDGNHVPYKELVVNERTKIINRRKRMPYVLMLSLMKKKRANINKEKERWYLWEFVFGIGENSLPEELQMCIINHI